MGEYPAAQVENWQPRQFLRPCLLLLLRESPAHGYDLLERLRDFALDRDAGGLYRNLRALEHEGLVSSEWEASVGGPDRRRYRLTRAGEARLATWSTQLTDLRDSLTRFVERFETSGESV